MPKKLMYNADMGRNRKIGSAHSQLFTNLISVFDVYTKLETVSDVFATCHVYSTYRWFNFFIMLLGVILFAVGTGLYASASLGRGSYEAVTFALAEKNNWQVKIVRIALDILVVIIGVLLGGKFGICTIITVIISGPIIQFVNAKAKRILKI